MAVEIDPISAKTPADQCQDMTSRTHGGIKKRILLVVRFKLRLRVLVSQPK